MLVKNSESLSLTSIPKFLKNLFSTLSDPGCFRDFTRFGALLSFPEVKIGDHWVSCGSVVNASFTSFFCVSD